MGKGNAKDTGAKGKGKAKAKDNADGKEEGKGKGLKPANSINVRHILKYYRVRDLFMRCPCGAMPSRHGNRRE
ncbi:hypothetical protein ACJ72_05954 [Emergomyces africanus]|uniref:Uncharacterized protein n=1 Tax=Emergomyces africanus TaxID=1955775 RepID=A0A1B7NSM1_9EURO|nr:hypothetical protein ACJ72_05954 [Emergomyces africanus]